MPSPDSAPPDPPAAGHVIEVELARGLGLAEALAIGIGTMICAGIFVLPGFIIAKAGPAAVLAFLLGGIVALFSAMSAAEVATGMPKSGGGYYFISRALGPLWGAVIGWASWFGLIFATAFYAVGFGEYASTVVPVAPNILGLVMTVLLVGLNLVGSKVAGQAQNLVVGILVGTILLFVGRGAADVDFSHLAAGFMPFGFGAVVAGTATLFVTYCGFGEIASMAEEIKDPGKNLPRALIGSVISVTVVYVVVLLVCVTLRPYKELTGPTILADLADDLMGSWGRGAILLGAVMASISSANASIMSASRIIFAMGRDRLVGEGASRVHPRFRVPHVAILMTGALTLALIIGGGSIELLAETAGLLHLLMYGLICVACIVLRGARPLAYRPSYRVPLYPLIPILGALGTLAVALFMDKATLAGGVFVIGMALFHYYGWGKKHTDLRGAWPHYLRRGVLEPALEQVERWGAPPDQLPTAVVAVKNPHRERARLELAAALMGESKGRVLAVNVFVVGSKDSLGDEVLGSYYETIEARSRALEESSAAIVRAGARAESLVPIAGSVFCALMSVTEASRASWLFVGWPVPGPDQSDQLGLLAGVAQHVRTHVLVLREQGPVPARNLLAVVDAGRHGDLAICVASRVASAWEAKLTVATLAPPGASAEEIVAVEADLEARIGDTVRADVQVIPAGDIPAALASEAASWDMIVLGVPQEAGGGLVRLMMRLESVSACSLVLVRAHEDQPIEQWM